MKVRRQLARRLAGSYALAKRDARWWDHLGLPDGEIALQPLRCRSVWVRTPHRLAIDLDALHAEAPAGIEVGPTDFLLLPPSTDHDPQATPWPEEWLQQQRTQGTGL